jgi:nucleoside-diphosphate-sugar epimerase
MKIAVTGGTGFIGRYILENLVAAGNTCRAWHRPTSDLSGLDHLQHGITWIEGDLAGPAAGKDLVEGCNAVVHGALHYPYEPYGSEPWDVVDFAEKNVIGTLRLMETSRAAGVERFIFISSGAVHEKILDDRPLDETHPLWPKTEYGAYKAAIEKFIHSYGFGENYCICSLRPTGVYGINHPVRQSKRYELVQSVVRGEKVEVKGGGKEVHAGDVAKAIGILLNAEKQTIAGEAFNCYDRYVSQHEVASLAKAISGSAAQIVGEPGRPKNEIVTNKIRSLGMQFGGEPLFRETITKLVEAIRATS